MSKDFGQVEVLSSYECENEDGWLVTHFNGGDGNYVSYEDYKELLAAYNKLQQSPAVAVPDCVKVSLTWLESALNCENFHWDGDQYAAAKYELEHAREWLKSAVNPPRITEQELIEIYRSINKNAYMAVSFSQWYEAEGCALLDKLNKQEV